MRAQSSPPERSPLVNVGASNPPTFPLDARRENGGPRRVPRRIGAVVAGFLVIAVLSTATDAVMHVTGIFPPLGQPMSAGLFWLAFGYRVVESILGCYVTARLAPDRPLLHALALGALGIVVSTLGAVVMRGAGPLWYPLALAAVSLPCAWVGGQLRVRQLR